MTTWWRGALLLASLPLAVLAGCTGLDDVTEPSCTYAVSPTSATFGPAGGPGQLAVTASGVCAWSVAEPPAWITVNGSRNGSGDGTVNYSVAPNTQQAVRSSQLTVAGRTITVTQNAAPCTFDLDPPSASFDGSGGRGSVTVRAATTCAWTASSNTSWIRMRSGQQGTGNGLVEFDVDGNPGGGERTGTLTIAGQAFTVTQSGASSPAAPSCSLSLSPGSTSIAAGGGSATITVSGPAGCDWSASTGESWIHITAGGSGSGSGSVQISVDANPSNAARAGGVSIGGQTVAILQNGAAGATCSYAVSPTTVSAAGAGETGTIQVGAPAGCNWTATSNVSWLTVASGNAGVGNGAVQYTVAPNPTTTARVGTITINGQPVTVTQSGQAQNPPPPPPGPTPNPPPPAPTCSYAIAPPAASFTATGGTGSLQVTAGAGCAWTAVSSASWVQVTTNQAGSGDGTVQYTVSPNQSTAARTATITVSGQAHTITQAAAPQPSCTYSVSPQSFSFDEDPNNGTIQVTTQAGCAWTATSSAGWLTFRTTPSGVGSGSVGIMASRNNSNNDRTGTITINGQVVTVNQAED